MMHCFIPGAVVPWSVKWGRGHTYIDPRLKAYKAKVAMFARNAGFKPLAGAVALRLHFMRAGGLDALPVGKPDLTNLVKSTEDALKGIAWKDDSQVVSLIARKSYTREAASAGVIVYVEEER